MAKDLIRTKQGKNEQLVNNINDGLIVLRKLLTERKFLRMKIQIKWRYCWKNPRLQSAKKCKGIEILTPKQMPQRLPIALAQEKGGNTSGNLLNEIRQIIYSLYQEKEVT